MSERAARLTTAEMGRAAQIESLLGRSLGTAEHARRAIKHFGSMSYDEMACRTCVFGQMGRDGHGERLHCANPKNNPAPIWYFMVRKYGDNDSCGRAFYALALPSWM